MYRPCHLLTGVLGTVSPQGSQSPEVSAVAYKQGLRCPVTTMAWY